MDKDVLDTTAERILEDIEGEVRQCCDCGGQFTGPGPRCPVCTTAKDANVPIDWSHEPKMRNGMPGLLSIIQAHAKGKYGRRFLLAVLRAAEAAISERAGQK